MYTIEEEEEEEKKKEISEHELNPIFFLPSYYYISTIYHKKAD